MTGAESSRRRAAFVLAGVRIAVTRPAGGTDVLARALEAEGAKVVRLPLIRIEPSADSAALRHALQSPDGWDWVVFTSANAVATFAAGVPSGRMRARIAAVGPVTAAAVETAGLGPSTVPATHRAEAIADAMAAIAPLPGARVLWPRGAEARGTLREALAAAGAEVHEIEMYRTVELPAAGRELGDRVSRGEVDVLTFTSPSAVRAFPTGGARKQGDVVVAVIGPVTAAAARAAGFRVDVEPVAQTSAAMVAALHAFYERRRGGAASEEGQ